MKTDQELGRGILGPALRTVEITIPGRPPTPNSRRHFMVVAKENRAWADRARAAAIHSTGGNIGPAMKAAELEITFVVATRIDHDWDNLIASTKPLTDGLVLAGLLADDSERVIRRITFPAIRYDRGNAATIYRITELDTGPEFGL
jgi:hypothetical protein